jgi:hypothetical protein
VKTVSKTKSSGWLLIGYDVPEEPSRIRVRIWRQLKRMGALYPQMSFCILPDSPENRSRLEALVPSLKGHGTTIVLQAKAQARPYLRTLMMLFKEDIEKEYRELVEECDEYLDEIKRNLSTGNVTQTEVSELEESLEGLERWFTKIRARDFLGSAFEAEVRRLLGRCRSALLIFSEKAQPKRIG